MEGNTTSHCNKILLTKPDPSKSKGLLRLSRTNLTLLTKAITGLNFLAYHQSKIDIEVSKYCSLCEEDDKTFLHLLIACLRLEETRREIFFDKPPTPGTEWSIRKLLQFAQTRPVFRTVSYTHLTLPTIYSV